MTLLTGILNLARTVGFGGALCTAALPAIPWRSGYFAASDESMPASEIDFSVLTHVIHWNVAPLPDGSLGFLTRGFTPAKCNGLTRRAHAAGVKVLLSISNQAPRGADFMVATRGDRLERLVAGLLSLADRYDYDGIDVDWEPLETPAEVQQYSSLIHALRTAIQKAGKPYLLTTAVYNQYSLLARLAPKLDQIHVMTYDLCGLYTGYTWHNAAMRVDEKLPLLSVDRLIRRFISAGVPSSKMSMGVPFYGYVWTGSELTPDDDIAAPLRRWRVAPVVSQSRHSEIMGRYFKPEYARWDVDAEVPYLSIRDDGYGVRRFVSYEDPRSIMAKVAYANATGLGLMIWNLSLDYAPAAREGERHPLVQALKEALCSLQSASWKQPSQ